MKKLIVFSTLAFSLLFLAGCGKKAETVTPEETTTTTTVETSTTTIPATKDQCMELMAYAFKVTQLQALGDTVAMTTWAQKANDLELQYRAEGREYEEACNKYLSNTADMNFYNDVQKRVKELK